MQSLLLLSATPATLHGAHLQALGASVPVLDVGKHVVHAHPICGLSGLNRVGLFIVCCVNGTNIAGLGNDVTLKLDIHVCTVGVGGYYLPETG